ncbi:unnamed protein product [Phaedon cochleariae]|uniref:Sm domain-containing protein n=1 Tax=Phaedon cochleariae TaxID=80249 RepID=A0A9P0GIH2_PHACE|nr:unnamed protein product [Phaedon cochleariae]
MKNIAHLFVLIVFSLNSMSGTFHVVLVQLYSDFSTISFYLLEFRQPARQHCTSALSDLSVFIAMADDTDVVEIIDLEDDDSDVEIIEIGKDDPRLDFFSDKFDPLLALRAPGVEVLDSTAKVFDNLSAYEVHKDDEQNPNAKTGRKQPKKAAEETVIQRKWKEHQLPVRNIRVRKVKNLWSKMEQMEGPLALLQKCIKERLRIKVWTRNDRRIRGYCLAYLVAFDKYWNMSLEDVTEVWSRPKKRKVPALDSVGDGNERIKPRVEPPSISVTPHATDKKLENCKRFVPQLLIRGEQVVIVNVVEDVNVEEKSKPEGSKSGKN